ncbi:SpaA isopeptide-forming pilin-related protein [Paenibacillus sp. N1-5-1-14]|uniref:collagen binding domain-containing protein n=1 Tax=Paenibacillus radicibacter TaxID=2972488 RepID=UPI002158D662|nr:collagen binding domain-containing protein [Paenibacillus radicibacter]MCR8643607.1 SpaA isopeptide-forming pilin-related protein [Paenibacillus radicibacter]
MKINTFKKPLLLMLILAVVLSSAVLPSQVLANVDTESHVTNNLEKATQVIQENLITGVKMYDKRPTMSEDGSITANGNEIQTVRPKVKDEVAIIFDWSLPNDSHKYEEGSTYTFQLPPEFSIKNIMSGKLTGGVGDYVVNTSGEVTFTFNDSIRGQKLEGNFYVWVAFDESKLGDGLKHKIDFKSVGQGIIEVNFINVADDKLKKSGVANKNNFNSDEIVWTVDFNQGEKEIKNAVLTDNLPADLVLKGDIEIRELIVQLNGTVKPGAVIRQENAFPIHLGDIHQAIRVTYTTSVTAPTSAPFKNKEFKNEVVLTGNDGNVNETDIGKATISFNEPLAKSGQESAYDPITQTITWKVQYNFNQQTISKDKAWIEDTFDTAKQELVNNSLKVFAVDIDKQGSAINPALVDSVEYTLTGVGTGFDEGFKLQFKNDISKAYVIEYQTKAKYRIYTNETVSNQVKIHDDTTKVGKKDIQEVIFAKRVEKEDFKNKTIKWKIVLNRDSKEMTDVVIVDDYEGRHMKLIPDSLSITGANKDDFVLVANDGDPDYTKGFRIELKPGVKINELHEFSYVTEFDPTAGKPVGNVYKNTATLNWKEDNKTQTPISKEAIVTPQNYTTDNGNKKGEYNAEEKTIKWTIDVNYNLFDIKNAIIKDAYTGEQTFVEGSLTVNKLILDTANNEIKPGDAVSVPDGGFKLNPDGKGFALNLGNMGKEAYRISYKTSLDGDVAIQGKYSNHATMEDEGTLRFTKSAEVEPKHGGQYIYKSGKQQGKSDCASWSITINPSQSYVGKNAVLTDTLSDNQILLKDTIKLYKTKIPGDNSGNVSVKGHLVPKTDYDLVVKDNTLTLTFKHVLKTAYILDYESFINADSGERIHNQAKFEGHTTTVVGNDKKEGIEVSLSGAGGGASTGKGKIKIAKVDDRNAPIEGVIFELYNASGTTLLETLAPTDANGETQTSREYRFNDKTVGLPYKLKEVSAPKGYLIDAEYGAAAGKMVSFKDGNAPFTIMNKIIRQGFELTKLDAVDANKKLKGAVFELRLNGKLIDTLTTGADGRIAKGDLPAGDYALVEVTAPDFYVVDATPIPVPIVANQTEIVTLTKTNVLGSDGKLILTKVDAKDHAVIEGVEFELRDHNDVVIAKKRTDRSGVIEFTKLPYGLYTLVETEAKGYVIEKAVTEVPIKQPETHLQIENKANDRSVILTKYNANKSLKLEGAVFELRSLSTATDLLGNPIYKVVTGIDPSKLKTDKNGELHLSNLEPNKYQLLEVTAPVGYLVDKQPIEFEIRDKQTEPTLVEKVNQRKPDEPIDPRTEDPGTETPVDPNKPIDPVDPDKKPPIDPNKPDPKPENPDGKVTTDPDTSDGGKVEVPTDNTTNVSKEPDHDKVGKPTGKDKGTAMLPQTGEESQLPLQLAGIALIIGGLLLARKKNRCYK